MEWTNALLISFAILLVLPAGFASGGEDRNYHAGAPVAVAGAAAYPAAAVSADASQNGDTSADAAVNRCPVPAEIVCQGGYVEDKQLDSSGCPIYYCRQVNGETSVSVAIDAEPQQVNVGDTITVTGKIAYNNPQVATTAAAAPQPQKFKVVTTISGEGSADLSAQHGKILFDSQADSAKPGDQWYGGIVKAVASAVSPQKADDSNTAEAGSTASGQADDGSTQQGSSSVAAVATSGGVSSSQERVDYISLNPGDATSITAYFTAGNPGIRVATIRVYEYTGTQCPPSTTPASGEPCSDGFTPVAKAQAKVSVVGKPLPVPVPVPPAPPENGSTNTTQVTGVFSLNGGWNMVSVPVMAKVSMADLDAACPGTASVAWRLTPGGYVQEKWLIPGYGYWIRESGSSCQYSVPADSYTTTVADLFSGWNLVGAPGSSIAASDFLSSCQITAGPWYYGNGGSTSQDPYAYSANLEPGKAYWIKVASSCSAGSEQPPAPPGG